MLTMSADLIQRIEQAYERCKSFPEAGAQGGMFTVRGDAYLALIELRNLCPEIVLALGRRAPGRNDQSM